MVAKKPAAAPTPFAGFPRGAMGFWHELANEMNREWFAANKERYQVLWEAPMHALLDQVRAGLAPVYAPRAMVAPKIMRIYRDVRFAKDKTPYKTHIGAVLHADRKGARSDDESPVVLYLHLGLDEEMVGAGSYRFGATQLARYRKAVLGVPGAALVTIADRVRAAGMVVGGHDDYVRVPRDLPAEHPRSAWLKLRGLTATTATIPRGLPHKPAFAPWLVEQATAMAPLVHWLQRYVA